MGKRAKEGRCVRALVRMAVPDLRAAEQRCPRTGPGAKSVTPDWVMAGLIMIAMIKKKKSKAAQYCFLSKHRKEIADWLGHEAFPSRSTYYRRYRRAHRFLRVAIRVQGERAIAEGVTDAQDVAVDKSLVAAQGAPWHQRDRQAGRVPAGVDCQASWGYSEHDGWTYGYSFEVIVSSTPGTTVFPLLASVDVASASEPRSARDQVAELPSRTRNVSADAGYDANYLGEAIEYDDHGRRTGRHFLCPENPRNHQRAKTKPSGADAARARGRELRRQRRAYLKSACGRRIYARRKKTVEPFNQWFKSLFELDHRVWHRGLDNNRTQMLAAMFVYQLLVRYNHKQGRRNAQLRRIVDAL
jgi:Transposase DDE domain